MEENSIHGGATLMSLHATQPKIGCRRRLAQFQCMGPMYKTWLPGMAYATGNNGHVVPQNFLEKQLLDQET